MGTTLNKLEYLDETKGQIKTALNQFNAQITDETTFRDYVDKINDIYDNWEKVTDEGTNITLNGVKKAKLTLGIKGNSTQESTTGKNLFNGNAVTTTHIANWTVSFQNNVLSITHNNSYSTGTPEINLGKLPSGTYVLSGILGTNIGLYRDGAYSNMLSSGATFSCSGSENISFVFPSSLISSGETKTYTNVQLELGSTPTSFEQYTGGIPAPNPNYSFPIKSVTGNNNVVVKNSDNTQSQTLPLNLGNIELNGIGEYKDYIYKNSGKWYKHEEIEKIASYNGETITTDYMSTTGQLITGATVYYGKTATDIEITDTNLINQLEEIAKANSYDPTTIITSTYTEGNAQMIINASALKKGSE